MKPRSIDDCAICQELSSVRATRLSRALGDDKVTNAVLRLSEHFAVIPSIGPLVLGHSLVVTRKHTSNILADASGLELRELRMVCEGSMNALLQGNPELRFLCFEHGSLCPTRRPLCSTEHGHLHLVPLTAAEISNVMNTIGGRSFEAADFQEIRSSITNLNQYITAFCLMPKKKELSGVFLDASCLPSQYLRKVIAREVGSPAWDWKRDANRDLLRKTLALGFECNVDLEALTSVAG